MGFWPFYRSEPDAATTEPVIDPGASFFKIPADKHGGAADGPATLATLASLLQPFEGPTIPAKARTDPGVVQKDKPPMTLAGLYQYLPFFASQGTALTKAFWHHHLFGPPKPSWGVELTLFTTFLRESAAYSHLSSLSRLRSVLDLGTLLPTPKDGIVTPISFRVKSRGLRGFLAEADAAEDGKRQITGEWVINRRLWKKMQSEFAVHKVVGKDRVILYLHGGAYYTMSAETHRYVTISCSRYTESRVFAINYRLAPETRFPGQLHDAVSAYMRLILDLKIPPENIIFAGDSAGGGLCVATMMYLRDEGYPLPSGAILMSPWVDLTMSCESWATNRPFDYLPEPQADDHLHPVKCLLGPEGIHKYLTHPYVSPLFGNFAGLPPLLIQAGEAEVLRDEITLLAHKASLAGVHVEHELYEDAVHVFQAFLFLEASRKAFQSQRQFVKYKLPSLNKPKDVPLAQMDAEIAADAHSVDEKGKAEPTSLPSSPVAKHSVELGPEPDEKPDRVDVEDPNEDTDDGERLSQSSGSDSPCGSMIIEPKEMPVEDSAPFIVTRPILRVYASARDLLMSKASSPVDSPASAPERRRHSRSSTVGSGIRTEVPEHRSLNARSSSHPDFRDLLAQYAATGPSNDTRVIKSQPPEAQLERVKARSRDPWFAGGGSFAGESPGFGFS